MITLKGSDKLRWAFRIAHNYPEAYLRLQRTYGDRIRTTLDSRKFHYIPFLGGPRRCLGDTFAWTEMQTTLCLILKRYRLELVGREPMPTRPITTLRMAKPLMMRVRRR
jgi:cytochrome P450